jgi:lipopolysaccharide transport system permease protein
VYFPRLVIPVAKILSLVVDLVVGLIVLGVFAWAYHVAIGWHVTVLPLFLLLALATGLGLGILLSALNVKYRDIGVAVPLFVQTWLFATPVIYPGTVLDGVAKILYSINPMVSVVDGARWALLGASAPSWAGVAVSSGSALVLLVTGVWYFARTEAFFADVV